MGPTAAVLVPVWCHLNQCFLLNKLFPLWIDFKLPIHRIFGREYGERIENTTVIRPQMRERNFILRDSFLETLVLRITYLRDYKT